MPRTAWHVVSPKTCWKNENLALLQHSASHWYLYSTVIPHTHVCIFTRRTNCHPASPFTSQQGTHLTCVCVGAGEAILPWTWQKEGNGSVDEDPPRTTVSSISHRWKVQRDLWPYKLSWGLFSIPSDYFIYQTFKYHIKILYPERVKFPKETSHTLRDLFMEMKVLEGNKKLGPSFLWLCPPCK